MGYHTHFVGRLELSPALNPTQIGVINRFSRTRHGGRMAGFMFSFYCEWIATPDGKYLQWNNGEKFSGYVAWLHHLNRMFFTRWQVTLSGEIRWQGDRETDVGLITATPVIREDGIRTTEIHPPTQLLDADLDDMREEDPQGLENSFIIYPGFIDWRGGEVDAKLKELETKSNPVIASSGWKLVGEKDRSRYKRFLKWDDGHDLHGCIQWLHWFVKIIRREDKTLTLKSKKSFLLGSVSLPGGLVITARIVNTNGKGMNVIEVSSPLLATPSLPEQETPGSFTNGLAVLDLNSRIVDIDNDVERFMEMKHGDVETLEPWIVPGSLSCGWRFEYGELVWGGGDDLLGCVHWLHQLNLRFFQPYGVLLVGSVRLPDGVVVKAEVEKRGPYAVTRITPKLPRYEHVRVGGDVEVREVDSTGWRVRCRVVSCKGNCGWFEEQQEVPFRKDYERKCPRCEQEVLWTKKLEARPKPGV